MFSEITFFVHQFNRHLILFLLTTSKTENHSSLMTIISNNLHLKKKVAFMQIKFSCIPFTACCC